MQPANLPVRSRIRGTGNGYIGEKAEAFLPAVLPDAPSISPVKKLRFSPRKERVGVPSAALAGPEELVESDDEGPAFSFGLSKQMRLGALAADRCRGAAVGPADADLLRRLSMASSHSSGTQSEGCAGVGHNVLAR